jgi:S1-C subfamily serine protease
MVRYLLATLVILGAMALPAAAQRSDDVVWVQIEARPNLAQAIERAEIFAQRLEDVSGFAVGGGWYAIALGPYRAADAQQVLDVYRREGLIPSDSYIALSRDYGTQFFPQGEDILRRQTETAPRAPEEPEVAEPAPPAPDPGEQAQEAETAQSDAAASPSESRVAMLEAEARTERQSPSEARAAEAALTQDARRGLQEALAWAGFYDSTIDGLFGRGTRSAMAEWQRWNGFEATGVLSTAQRALLIGQYNEVLEGLGLALYRDEAMGLEAQLPLGAVTFERYAPPFAHFAPTGDLAARVLLISQPGGRATLESLYDVMQTLEIVPLDGPRELGRDSFTLTGRSPEIVSETRVRLENGALKGFTLVWPAGDETRRQRLIDEMQRSFVRLEGVMDPGLGAGDSQRIDFVSGLAVRKPRVARSGFFVDSRGTVVTTADAVEDCGRILLDDAYEAQVASIDPARRLAVLTPRARLAPPQIAQFSAGPPQLQTAIAVAGYSYEGALNAPSVTFGTLSDLAGLSGEQELNRLDLASLPGDAGGPVFDARGHVIGMLLPRRDTDRLLPETVNFALTGEAIAAAVRTAGVSPISADGSPALAPEDITSRGMGMTVLVSCWD